MTMNVTNAQSSGFSPQDIISFLNATFPYLAAKIQQAQSMGHNVQDIVQMLQGVDPKRLKQMDREAQRSPHLGIGSARAATLASSAQTKLPQYARQAASLALPAMGAMAAYPAIARGLPKLAQVGQNLLSKIGLQPKPISATLTPAAAQPIAQQAAAQPLAGTAAQTTPLPAVTPAAPAAPAIHPSTQKLREFGPKIIPAIENMKERNPPEVLAEMVHTIMDEKERRIYDKKVVRGEAKPIIDLVKDYLTTQTPQKPQETAKESTIAPEGIQPQPQPQQVAPEAAKTPSVEIQTEKPKKGDLVFDASSGISGEIRDIKQKQALVHDEGKLHKAQTEDLVPIPIAKKDLDELQKELEKEIEAETGEEISHYVNVAAYDPENNALLFKPHVGDVYVYDDISEEDANALRSLLKLRSTTGENFMGQWVEGTKSPIGSQLSALIRKIQAERGGKGKEYTYKFKKLYDPYSLPLEERKRKYSEQKALERKIKGKK